MREDRLDALLRDRRAHLGEPLDSGAVRAAQDRALERFAQESKVRAPVRGGALLRWLEAAALPCAAAGVLLLAADWLGSLWSAAAFALQDSGELLRVESGWLERLGSVMAAQPWLVVCGAASLALLWLPPVRAALLGERE